MRDLFCDPFPKSVTVGDRDFPIRTDFRDVLRMLRALNEEEDQAGRLEAILGLYEVRPPDGEAAIKAVADFLSGYEDDGETTDERKEKGKKTLSYKKDAPYIVGDFLRFYGIDLTECRYLHWLKFQALLLGLSGESETKKRIAYRCMDAGKIKDKQERARIRRIQRELMIEDEADEERIGELFGGLC